jgi:hypothetical protein
MPSGTPPGPGHQKMAEVPRKGGSRMSLNLRLPRPLGYTAPRGRLMRGGGWSLTARSPIGDYVQRGDREINFKLTISFLLPAACRN